MKPVAGLGGPVCRSLAAPPDRVRGRRDRQGVGLHLNVFTPRLMTRSALFLLAALLMLGCAAGVLPTTAQEAPPRGKLFIIGGGARPPELMDPMIDMAGLRDGGYAVILPMSSSEPDSAILWSSVAFQERGLPVVGFNFILGETPPPSRLDSLRKAALIYISGGDQARFMDVVRGTPIEAAIHDAYRGGSVIAGTSAGAAVMSEQMITGTQRLHPNTRRRMR